MVRYPPVRGEADLAHALHLPVSDHPDPGRHAPLEIGSGRGPGAVQDLEPGAGELFAGVGEQTPQGLDAAQIVEGVTEADILGRNGCQVGGGRRSAVVEAGEQGDPAAQGWRGPSAGCEVPIGSLMGCLGFG